MEPSRVCKGTGELLLKGAACPLCDADPYFRAHGQRDDMPEEPANASNSVNPFAVEGAVNYDKLIDEFGCNRIGEDLIKRIERITGCPAHPLLRRGMFYSHRDLSLLLDDYEGGVPFYLYTGRGASSESLHIGHLMPFLFTKYMQEAFDVPVVIQLTDDEKFYYKEHISLEEAHRLAYLNAKDIMACGFNPGKTFIFTDLDYMGTMYPVVAKAAKLITFNVCRGVLGDNILSNIGRVMYPAIQAAPAFPGCFPTMFGTRKDIRCLIPQGIDQDPFFRLCRDIAPRMGETKPACIHCKFFPALEGANSKMASSAKTTGDFTIPIALDKSGECGFIVEESLIVEDVKAKALKKQGLQAGQSIKAVNGKQVFTLEEYLGLVKDLEEFVITVAPMSPTIFVVDNPITIREKVKRYAFSGGQDTRKLQEKFGANLEVDVPYQYLRHIMEDDVRLNEIGRAYSAGEMMTGDVKKICADELIKVVKEHQERLAQVTGEAVRHIMNPNRESLRFFSEGK